VTTPILSVTDVRKSYGRGSSRCKALGGVSLAVAEGESVAIIGESGSGKLSLMHVRAFSSDLPAVPWRCVVTALSEIPRSCLSKFPRSRG
jgi:predicted ABC-type transport system involved in lysophospholipase L1 biosynthesis ATPase subunit